MDDPQPQQMELTSENVHAILGYCLFNSEEAPEGGPQPPEVVRAEGAVGKYGFHPGRLAEMSSSIAGMLSQLPSGFRADKGGGWSFLNACYREDGVQWTGEHRMVDALLCLGIATGNAKLLLPREFWPSLPGGMPYFAVTVPPLAATA